MKAERLGTTRLMVTGVVLLLLFIILAGAAFFSSKSIEQSSESISVDAVPGTVDAYDIRLTLSHVMSYTMFADFQDDDAQKNSALQTASDNEKKFNRILDKYKGTILINPAKDSALVTDLTTKWANYIGLRAKYVDLIRARDRTRSAAYLNQVVIPAFDSVRDASDDLVTYNHKNAITYANDIKDNVQSLRTTVVIVMALASLCVCILFYIISVRRRELYELITSDEEIKRLNAELEKRIAERTVELAMAIKQTAFLEAQVDAAIDGMLVVDSQNQKILQNQRMNDLFKIPRDIVEELDDSRQVAYVASRTINPQPFLQKVRYLYAHPNEISRDEVTLVDGTVLDRYSSPVRGKGSEYFGRIWTFRDITERKHAELRLGAQLAVTRALAEGESLSQTTYTIIDIICIAMGWDCGGLWTMDSTTKSLRCVNFWHPPKSDLLEFADLSKKLTFIKGAGLPGRIWASRQPLWIADIAQDSNFRLKTEAARVGLLCAIGFPVTLREEVLGVVGFYSKETRQPGAEIMMLLSAIGTQIGQFIERKQLEGQFHQAQKMEAMGTLAGGIAHDFNNILAAMAGYTELAKMGTKDNPKVREYLDTIQGAGKRATELVKQILTFSRQEKVTRQPVQLQNIVAESFKLLRATIPATIDFKITLAYDTPTVLADTSQIHQVLMNLGTNAWHAMKDRPGCLEVRLETCLVDAYMVEVQPRLRQGTYARITVSDNGCGMDQATLERIFEPFFTTKPPGEGTGLGLSVLYGIMQNHEGVVTVYSQPGEGTAFHLYFPAHAGQTVTSSQENSTPKGSRQRILYLDDEEILTQLAKNTLELLGYQVETQTNALEVLAMFKADPQRFDLVITDYTMPGMTGTELAKQLLQIRPDLPIILTTGYAATLTPEYVRTLGMREFLLKPHTIDSLAKSVHRALSEK